MKRSLAVVLTLLIVLSICSFPAYSEISMDLSVDTFVEYFRILHSAYYSRFYLLNKTGIYVSDDDIAYLNGIEDTMKQCACLASNYLSACFEFSEEKSIDRKQFDEKMKQFRLFSYIFVDDLTGTSVDYYSGTYGAGLIGLSIADSPSCGFFDNGVKLMLGATIQSTLEGIFYNEPEEKLQEYIAQYTSEIFIDTPEYLRSIGTIDKKNKEEYEELSLILTYIELEGAGYIIQYALQP